MAKKKKKKNLFGAIDRETVDYSVSCVNFFVPKSFFFFFFVQPIISPQKLFELSVRQLRND